VSHHRVLILITMKTIHRVRSSAPANLGFLLDELRSAGVTTYADLAATLNKQGLRSRCGRWSAHDLYLLMRRHRRAHPVAAICVGTKLYARRAKEARRVMRRLKRSGLTSHAVMARALNARGVTTPGLGRPWTARNVSRVLAGDRNKSRRKRSAKPTLH
jgi:hypothetical protein